MPVEATWMEFPWLLSLRSWLLFQFFSERSRRGYFSTLARVLTQDISTQLTWQRIFYHLHLQNTSARQIQSTCQPWYHLLSTWLCSFSPWFRFLAFSLLLFPLPHLVHRRGKVIIKEQKYTSGIEIGRKKVEFKPHHWWFMAPTAAQNWNMLKQRGKKLTKGINHTT